MGKISSDHFHRALEISASDYSTEKIVSITVSNCRTCSNTFVSGARIIYALQINI